MDLNASQMAQNRAKRVKTVSKWLQRGKLDQNKVAILQNAQKTASRAQIVVHSHQIAPQGRSRSHRFAAFWPARAKFGAQRGLKAPFAAKFGLHLGLLTVLQPS